MRCDCPPGARYVHVMHSTYGCNCVRFMLIVYPGRLFVRFNRCSSMQHQIGKRAHTLLCQQFCGIWKWMSDDKYWKQYSQWSSYDDDDHHPYDYDLLIGSTAFTQQRLGIVDNKPHAHKRMSIHRHILILRPYNDVNYVYDYRSTIMWPLWNITVIKHSSPFVNNGNNMIRTHSTTAHKTVGTHTRACAH